MRGLKKGGKALNWCHGLYIFIFLCSIYLYFCVCVVEILCNSRLLKTNGGNVI